MFVAGCILVALGLALAVRIHDFFEGEDLIRDMIDEWRLSKRSLDALGREWSANSNRADVIVTLTTIPSRIGLIAPTLKSLLRQSAAPKRIILNIPWQSHRENSGYSIPDFLQEHDWLWINRCDDAGPATKLLPTLGLVDDETRLIVVDDDRIYPRDLIAQFLQAAKAKPDAAFGASGWNIPPDGIDRPTTIITNLLMHAPAPIRGRRLLQQRRVDILQGFSGYLLKPAQIDPSLEHDLAIAPQRTRTVDDVWISAYLVVPRIVVPMKRGNYQPKFSRTLYRRTSLGLLNRSQTGRPEDRANSIAIRLLRDRFQDSPRNE